MTQKRQIFLEMWSKQKNVFSVLSNEPFFPVKEILKHHFFVASPIALISMPGYGMIVEEL